MRGRPSGWHGWARYLGWLMRHSTRGLASFWREGRYARRATIAALGLYHVVRAERPDLTGKALYQEVIARHSGLDAEAAHALIESAEKSYAEWPDERRLAFRDVVRCMVFHGVSRYFGNRHWVRVDIRRIVASLVPRDL